MYESRYWRRMTPRQQVYRNCIDKTNDLVLLKGVDLFFRWFFTMKGAVKTFAQLREFPSLGWDSQRCSACTTAHSLEMNTSVKLEKQCQEVHRWSIGIEKFSGHAGSQGKDYLTYTLHVNDSLDGYLGHGWKMPPKRRGWMRASCTSPLHAELTLSVTTLTRARIGWLSGWAPRSKWLLSSSIFRRPC